MDRSEDNDPSLEVDTEENASSPRSCEGETRSPEGQSTDVTPTDTLQPTSPRKLGKRKNFCPFCKKLLTNLTRHIKLKHPDQERVRKYTALATRSPNTRRLERRKIANAIRHIGNDMYNREVIEGLRKSDLIPAKRSPRIPSNVTHVACKHCLGLFKKASLFRHVANCDERGYEETTDRISTGAKRIRILNEHAKLLVPDIKQASELLKSEVFPKMRKDLRTVVAQSDSLICRFGSDFRFNHRGVKQSRYCSSKMRSLAQLLITMKKMNPNIGDMSQCIRPRNFNTLMEAVRKMSQFDVSVGDAKAPSVSARLCSSLKGCANITKSETIKSCVLTRAEKTEIICEMNDFLHLMEKDWAKEIGTNSENSRRRAKVVKDDVLPDPDDLRIFNEYIHELCPRYVTNLERLPCVKNYEKLAKLAIVHIISLNRRRPNETVEITKEAYQNTLNKRLEYETTLQSGLTEEELKSGEELAIFYIAANKNLRKVPVLLTEAFRKAIDTLLEAHSKLGIESRYLFARPGDIELFDGSAVLREMAKKANLKYPSTFTANALRHHAATSSQLHARNDTYTKRLSVFMGHDLRTHEDFYEMPLPLVQKSIVGHRLLQMVKRTPTTCTVTTSTAGPSTSVAKMPTHETPQTVDGFQHIPTTESDSDGEPLAVIDEPHHTTTLSTVVLPSETKTTAKSPHFTDEVVNSKANDPSFMTPPRTHETIGGDGMITDSEGSSHFETPPRKIHPKRKWSTEEKKSIYRRFSREIIMKMKPTRSDIKMFWESEPKLKERTLPQVITYVHNIVSGKHHVPTPTRLKMKEHLQRK